MRIFRVISRLVAPVFNPTLLIRSFLFFSELFVYSGYQPSVRYIAGKKKKMKNKTHSSILWSAFSSSGLISYTKAFQCYEVSIGQLSALILELRESNSGTHSLNLYLVGYCLYLLLEKSQHFRFHIETYVSFSVSCFLCMVICVCVCVHSSTCWHSVFPASFVEDAAFSPVCYFDIFVKYELAIIMSTCVWVFCFVHWSMCLFLCCFFLLLQDCNIAADLVW